jgi:transposase
MLKKSRKYSAQFKFEIALEAAKELKTITELSSEHGVHPNQISQWKRQPIEQGAEVFTDNTADQHKMSLAGGVIAVEAPTYLGALQAFNPYGPAYVCLDRMKTALCRHRSKELSGSIA